MGRQTSGKDNGRDRIAIGTGLLKGMGVVCEGGHLEEEDEEAMPDGD